MMSVREEAGAKQALRVDGGGNCHQRNKWKRKRGQFNEEEEEDGQKTRERDEQRSLKGTRIKEGITDSQPPMSSYTALHSLNLVSVNWAESIT